MSDSSSSKQLVDAAKALCDKMPRGEGLRYFHAGAEVSALRAAIDEYAEPPTSPPSNDLLSRLRARYGSRDHQFLTWASLLDEAADEIERLHEELRSRETEHCRHGRPIGHCDTCEEDEERASQPPTSPASKHDLSELHSWLVDMSNESSPYNSQMLMKAANVVAERLQVPPNVGELGAYIALVVNQAQLLGRDGEAHLPKLIEYIKGLEAACGLSQTKESSQVGCEGNDGLLRVHSEAETCDVCQTDYCDRCGASMQHKPDCPESEQAAQRAKSEREVFEIVHRGGLSHETAASFADGFEQAMSLLREALAKKFGNFVATTILQDARDRHAETKPWPRGSVFTVQGGEIVEHEEPDETSKERWTEASDAEKILMFIYNDQFTSLSREAFQRCFDYYQQRRAAGTKASCNCPAKPGEACPLTVNECRLRADKIERERTAHETSVGQCGIGCLKPAGHEGVHSYDEPHYCEHGVPDTNVCRKCD